MSLSQLDSLRAHVATRPAPGGVAASVASVASGSAGGAAAAGRGAQVVVVGSGRGGAGTSVLAALLALAAAGAGRRVLLVDADEHVGPHRFLLGVAPAHALGDLRHGLPLDALAVPVSATLSLVPGGPGMAGAAAGDSADAPPIPPAERRALLRRVTSLHAGHDVVVVDGGSRLDTVSACVEAALPTAAAADAAGNPGVRLLVVSGADPIALAASYALVKAVTQRAPAVTPLVLANRLDDDAAAHALAQLDQATRHFLDRPLTLAGAVPDDGCLDVALRAGMLLHDAAAGSPAALAIQPIAERLFDRFDPTAGRGRAPFPFSPARDRPDARDPRPAGVRPASSIAALSYGIAR